MDQEVISSTLEQQQAGMVINPIRTYNNKKHVLKSLVSQVKRKKEKKNEIRLNHKQLQGKKC